jgi:prolipoprotein diacylglyceryl transferase
VVLFFSYFFWDPSRVAFYIPIIDHPILWYSLLFAGGFFVGYLLAARLIYQFLLEKRSATPQEIRKSTFTFLDRLAWYVFVGMIVGARLGHVFFYEWPYFEAHPLEILYTWEGGLSSHGAGFGLLIGLLLFWKNPKRRLPELSFLRLLDFLCIATAFVAGSIRLGNFFNQEILGTPSDLPFAVWFGHPADLGARMPCHPVQLYEAIFYFFCCGLLYSINRKKVPESTISGLFFVLIFTFRFFIEFLKMPQGYSDHSGLYMGQLLSLPFILLGVYLLWRAKKT